MLYPNMRGLENAIITSKLCCLYDASRHAGLHQASVSTLNVCMAYSWGVANRGASIRVGRSVPVAKCGYYEDRRPSSNLDPYVVCRLIVETALLS